MRRRDALALTALSVGALGLGVGIANWTPGLNAARLSLEARRVMGAVAATMLNGVRPPMTEAAVAEHLNRLDQLVAGLPEATRSEISDLLGIISIPPGRWALAGLAEPWALAPPASVAAALQSMRTSTVLVRQQAYQALRELTFAAHFSQEASWAPLGYPGPRPL